MADVLPPKNMPRREQRQPPARPRASSLEEQQRPEASSSYRVTPLAAKELQRWLRPWSPNQGDPSAGLFAMIESLRTWVAFRWGRKALPAAQKRLWEYYLGFGAWNPRQLHQQLQARQINPHLSMRLQGERLLLDAPQGQEGWKTRAGEGGMTLDIQRLPRTDGAKLDPFRVVSTGAIGIVPIQIAGVDQLLHDFMKRALSPDLQVEKDARGAALFPSLKDAPSRRIADWLISRIPRTTAVLDRYFDVKSGLKILPDGRKMMDLQLFWRTENIKTDYPGWYKQQQTSKTRIFFQTEFLDEAYRRWLVLTYSSQKNYYRFQAVIHPDGFLRCDDAWAPTLAETPWRPTHKLKSNFVMRTQIFFSSTWLTVGVSDILLHWKIRPHEDGASMSFRFNRPPRLKLQGGNFLRSVARVVIPGGIGGLFQRLLNGMTRGDGGKGMRFSLRLRQGKPHAAIHFRLAFPVVPDKILSAVLRMIPGMYTREPSRVATRQPTADPKRPRLRTRYSPRRVLPAFWHRVMTAMLHDLQDAHAILSTATKPTPRP